MNTDATFADLTPPVWRRGRGLVTGRHLSADQWAYWAARVRACELADALGVSWQWPRLVRELTDAVFPRPWHRWGRSWIADDILRRPAEAQVAAVQHLLALPAALTEAPPEGDEEEADEAPDERGPLGVRTPHQVLVGQFVRCYGAGEWRCALYPTTDHIIPAAWFAARVSAMPALLAGDRLSGAVATALGAAVAFGGKESKAPRLVRALSEQAAPKVYDPLPDALSEVA